MGRSLLGTYSIVSVFSHLQMYEKLLKQVRKSEPFLARSKSESMTVTLSGLLVAIVDVADNILLGVIGRHLFCEDEMPDIGFACKASAFSDDNSILVFPAPFRHICEHAHGRGKRILFIILTVVDPAIGVLALLGYAKIHQSVDILFEEVVLDAHHYTLIFSVCSRS